MPEAPHAALDPFAVTVRGLAEPNAVHAALRAAGPIVRAEAPAGGPVWIVTDYALARDVFADPRIAKDPAFAPVEWGQRAGLEPTAAAQPSLTTLDGAAHTVLRRAHNPLFSTRRMRDFSVRMTEIARELLTALATTGGTIDLMADFTTRYPLAVLFDLLGAPMDRVDEAIEACRRMYSDDPAVVGMAMAAFAELAGAALSGSQGGLAAELRDQIPAEMTEKDLHYLLFTLLYAGQLTTDASLGFLLAHVLDGTLDQVADADAVVMRMLRLHPPAPFTLWRFTTTEIELGGVSLPANAPLLVDIEGINNDPARADGPDLTFGAGPHFCLGAQLAQLELRAVVDVLREDFPGARLAVPFAELRQAGLGNIQGSRLTALPITLGE